MFDFLKPDFQSIPNVKLSYNIGSLFDVPNGSIEIGIHGESILNGGVSGISAFCGIGNNFKSTISHYCMLSAGSKFKHSTFSTYDTEINITESRLKLLVSKIENFKNEDIIRSGRWSITDKTAYFGNEWFEKFKDFLEAKIKNSDKITVDSPFIGRDGKLMPMLIPTFTELDSLTKFNTKSSNLMQESNELGDSAVNTLYMKEGQAKKQMISYLPKPVQQANNPMFITAHIGKNIPMDPRAAPIKKLQFLKNNDTLKGVTDDFTFLTTTCWQCQNATPFFNDGTRGPEYPRDSEDNMKGDTDLFLVTLVQLRSKTGPSGLIMQILVSQQEGVLPSLSEFHYIKTNDRFGLGGNVQNYFLDLLPDVKLSRTTVRGKIDSNAQLRRAMNITSEMCQMKYLWHDLPEDLLCTPKELRDDLIKLGYDWEKELLNTRGWWTANNDSPEHDLPYLSTMDLLKMRKGLYKPFWMDEQNKRRKEFIK